MRWPLATKARNRIMPRDGRARRPEPHQGARGSPVEEPDQRLVVAACVIEYEAFEGGVALLPACRSEAQQRLEVVEVRLLDRFADLVGAVEMTGEAKGGADLVLAELVRGLEVTQPVD